MLPNEAERFVFSILLFKVFEAAVCNNERDRGSALVDWDELVKPRDIDGGGMSFASESFLSLSFFFKALSISMNFCIRAWLTSGVSEPLRGLSILFFASLLCSFVESSPLMLNRSFIAGFRKSSGHPVLRLA